MILCCVQWHNHAIKVIEELRLHSLNVFYEDYETNFNTTVNKIFDFLELQRVNPGQAFVGGKTYINFFTERERQVAMIFLRRIATNETWSLLKRYEE
jgi:hypothetical protein